MPSSAPSTESAQVPAPTMIPVGDLFLDDRNPRFYGDDGGTDQESLLKTLWRDFAVDEIALSVAANGYFDYEPIFAAKEGGRLVVVEGNRRLAAVKLLISEELRRHVGATDLPNPSTAVKALPVVITPRDSIWQFVGFKHVNGAQPWQSFSKAQYIAWVHNEVGVDLDEIARRIGDQHTTVKRLYRGLMVLRQAEGAGFDIEDRSKKHFSFSHLYTGLDYPGFRKVLGLTETRDYTPEPIPPSRLGPLREICVWLYGSASRSAPPVIKSQNPDLRNLDEVLQSADGLAALRQGLPLGVSLDISRGDARLFREALVRAKSELQSARGKVLSGYDGEPDLLQTAEDILELANSVIDDMERLRRQKRTSSTARRRQ